MKILLLILALAVALPGVAAITDDRVAFTPGSQMIGELKRLERGKLHFKTPATDQIAIDWDNITELVSNQQLQVELTNGIRHLGNLVPAGPAELAVQTATRTVSVPLDQVILITPIEDTFRDRLDVDLSAGYNLTKSNHVRQLNFGLTAKHTTERRRNRLKAELITTDDSEGDESTRWILDLNSTRLRENRWLTGYVGKLEQNDGLGLDLRSSIGIGGGRYVRQTNHQALGFLAGLLASHEEIDGSNDSETTLESSLAVEYELFRFGEPEIDLSTKLEIFPNLSDFGRVRGEYDLSLRWELIRDFYWEVSFYASYDSDPVSEDADKNDYGIVTGIAWDL